MLSLIRYYFSGDQWLDVLSPTRKESTERYFKDRKERNVDIDMLSCTQFADKKCILKQKEQVLELFSVESKNKFNDYLDEIEKIRNDIAHAQTIRYYDWNELYSRLKRIETTIHKIDSFLESDN